MVLYYLIFYKPELKNKNKFNKVLLKKENLKLIIEKMRKKITIKNKR